LDPQLLLDFLTDRLQIWRVMQDVSDFGLADDPNRKETKAEEEYDEVQQWWSGVVETQSVKVRQQGSTFQLILRELSLRSFSTLLPAAILGHHRAKLFPAASATDALSQRLVPAPSPFKDRSLMSLDRSARRKERESQQLVAQSPTMKRLIGKSNSTLPGPSDHDIFKVPSLPTKKHAAMTSMQREAARVSATLSSTGQERTQQPPRKQERPQPLARAPSLPGSSKGLFNRREVSLSRRSSGLGLKKRLRAEAESKEPPAIEKEKEPRRRKSASPRSEFRCLINQGHAALTK
jgi:hypothetical protein